jgi:DNA-binding CsgD family transcriptional regulator
LARAEELLRTDEASLPAFHHPTVKATVRIWGGDPAGAVDAALSGMSREGANPASCEDLATLAARGLADLAQSCRDGGIDPAAHVQRLEQLRLDFPQVMVDFAEITEDYQLELDAHNALYDAETARARASSDAQERWIRAVELLGNTHLSWYESYACWRAADALLAGEPGRRERGQAAQMLRHGHAMANRLGCQPVQHAVEALARAARVSLAPVDAQEGPPGGVGALNQLTRREHEVLAHVVAGRTYAEIASALFLSEKTVSSHISNILRKTGASNRVELASLAKRNAEA